MKVALFYELIQFSFSKKTLKERMKYTFFALIFFLPMAKIGSRAGKNNTSAEGSLSGDDIYPLF